MWKTICGLSSALLLVACGGGGTGQVRVYLTDSPADLDNVSQVLVTIDEVRVHTNAGGVPGPDGGGPDDTGGAGWIVLCRDLQTLNLLDLTGGRFAPLCLQPDGDGGMVARAITVPAGRISQARVNVVSARLVFNDGSPPVDLTVPSGSTSGLKFNVQRDVPAGGVLDFRIDFDAAMSIHRTGSGEWKLTPLLKTL